MRVSDNGSGSRPADEIVLSEQANILAEHKRTEGMKFELSFLRPNQLQGLLDFDEVIQKNYGLVFVSFLNHTQNRDQTFVFRLMTALRWMKRHEIRYIHLDNFVQKALPALEIQRLADGFYDLKGVPGYCKSL